MTTLAVRGLTKSFGGIRATDEMNLEVSAGEIHAIIGPNGAGKTTLINQLSGELTPNAGAILLDNIDVTAVPIHQRVRLGIARSYQITSVFMSFTALQNVMLAVQGQRNEVFSFWNPVTRDTALVDQARELLARVGLQHVESAPVAALAHGARRQLELAMTLALKPKVMLLDEPLAGMSRPEAESMVALLQSLRGTCSIVLVEHDMDAVFSLADAITVVVYGKPIATGTPDRIRNDRSVREAYLGDETHPA